MFLKSDKTTAIEEYFLQYNGKIILENRVFINGKQVEDG